MTTRKELIKKYIKFFKKNNHKEIPNSSLIPENDSTVLFTTAGMHPLVPYLLGQSHPLGKKLTNVQRCIRTGDIEEVGDATHHTFFEMLGNWSLGDYFKKEAIQMSFEFLTGELEIAKENLAVSVFKGDKDASRDNGAVKTWESLGIPKSRIMFLSKSENWWGPAGKTGPCGPDTEIFYWSSKQKPPEKFDPEDKRWVEIWNNVLMGYNKNKKGIYEEAKQKNIDTGMGVERTLAVLSKLDDNYMTEVFKPIIEKIEKLSGKNYGDYKKEMRIIADHIKSSVFIIAEGISPSNTEQGYVLRRLIRRAVRYGKNLGIKNFTKKISEPVFEIYDDYEHLQKNRKKILEELEKEEIRFEKTLEKGLARINIKLLHKGGNSEWVKNKKISGRKAFLLYQSYGFPIELTEEIAKEKGYSVDKKGFEFELKKHQKLSRTASAGKFKSGLADDSEATTKLHTATHLLLAALKTILRDETIIQKGSNITSERLRFDFAFGRKLTKEELEKIEELVNAQIQRGCEVVRKEMLLKEAKKKGAAGIFDKKYGEKVSVYMVGDFSKEICTGPHVKNTCELGHFKIKKEESSSSGVRRIKAILEK